VRRIARCAAAALIVGGGALLLTSPALARIVRAPTGAGDNPKVGGERITTPGKPVLLACLPYGTGISERYGTANLNVMPQSVVGWAPAEPGQGRSILVPYGDGLAACPLSSQQDSWARSFSAMQLAVITSRQAAMVRSWRFSRPHVVVHGTLLLFGHKIPVPGWWRRFF
jgi:hypothetical protein